MRAVWFAENNIYEKSIGIWSIVDDTDIKTMNPITKALDVMLAVNQDDKFSSMEIGLIYLL